VDGIVVIDRHDSRILDDGCILRHFAVPFGALSTRRVASHIAAAAQPGKEAARQLAACSIETVT
jgi:hypothetical protein